MEYAQHWVVEELKKLRFIPRASEKGVEEWDRAQVTFPTQELAQGFVSKIPTEIKQELGLRIEGDLATGTTSLLVKHAPFRRLMAQDFATFVTPETPRQLSV